MLTTVQAFTAEDRILNQTGRDDSIGGFSYLEALGQPKMIKQLAEQAINKDDIILDFFGGSGTTVQAVLELNQQDNGNRKFILVQLPEQTKVDSEAYKAGFKKISDITIECVKQVINGYGDNPQPLEAGFKVYQLTKSHFPRVDFKPDPELSEAENLQRLEDYITEKEA